eukprot:4238996-Alexandrium_andersonii.AAC.1
MQANRSSNTPQGMAVLRLPSSLLSALPPVRPSAPFPAIGRRGSQRLYGGAVVSNLAPQPET